MAAEAFDIHPQLTAVAVAYKNPQETYIADKILPRVPTGEVFKWTKYSPEQGYTIPNTYVGPKSEPNMIDFQGTAVTDQTNDYGLEDLVTNREIKAFEEMPKPASGGPIPPMEISAMFLKGLIMVAREIRAAGLVFNAANYPAGNQATLSGTSQWSDQVNSNPVLAIRQAMDVPLIRPKYMALGRQVWTMLSTHPKVLQGVFRTQQTGGVASIRAVADLLELDDIFVGDGFYNTAGRGQAPVYQRVWGKHALLFSSSPMSAMAGQPTFGFTAQFGDVIAGTLPAPEKGLRGGVRVRVGESVKEVLTAPDAAYFFQNAVA
jgi:hypothetical protein